jgi:hypothetical protein
MAGPQVADQITAWFTWRGKRFKGPPYNPSARPAFISSAAFLLVRIGRLTMLRVALIAAIAASASAFSPSSSFLPAHGLRTRASSSATGVRMYVLKRHEVLSLIFL